MTRIRFAVDAWREAALGPADSARRGVLTGFADQALSSASNASILVALGRVSSVSEFGSAAVLMTLLTAALAIVRSGVGTPAILLTGQAGCKLDDEASGGLAAAAMLGLCVGCGVILLGAALMAVGPLAFPIAVAAPIVLQQDVLRHVSIARDAGRSAVAFDGLWMAVSVVVLVATAFTTVSPVQVLWVWTFGG